MRTLSSYALILLCLAACSSSPEVKLKGFTVITIEDYEEYQRLKTRRQLHEALDRIDAEMQMEQKSE